MHPLSSKHRPSDAQHLFYLGCELCEEVLIRLRVVTRLLHLVTQGYLDECHIKDLLVVLGSFISLCVGVHRLRNQTGGVAVERFVLRAYVHRHVGVVDVKPYAQLLCRLFCHRVNVLKLAANGLHLLLVDERYALVNVAYEFGKTLLRRLHVSVGDFNHSSQFQTFVVVALLL